NLDSDCDGLSDEEEFSTVYATGLKTSPSDADTDNDGLSDGMEMGRTSSVDPRCAGRFNADQDPTTQTDPTRADTDHDGIPDGIEDVNRDGLLNLSAETDPRTPDTDGDGFCDGTIDVSPVCTANDPTPNG